MIKRLWHRFWAKYHFEKMVYLEPYVKGDVFVDMEYLRHRRKATYHGKKFVRRERHENV